MAADCPLCRATDCTAFYQDRQRSYLRCTVCSLVFVPPAERLDRDAERREYELHENHLEDPGYRRFLSRLCEPLLERLEVPSVGLDFGCGPAPALAAMLEAAGHQVELHDSFFYPNDAALTGLYDFITATEVVEHLHSPGAVLDQLWGCLRPGGILGIMTKLVLNREAFAGWHYIRDPTHVCFFSEETWRWWTSQVGGSLTFVQSDVVMMQKISPVPD